MAGPTPRLRIEGACRALGRDEVIRRCVALLEGVEVDPEFLVVVGGLPATRLLVAGLPHDQQYWLRVWALRGLLWASPGRGRACGQANRRVRGVAGGGCFLRERARGWLTVPRRRRRRRRRAGGTLRGVSIVIRQTAPHVTTGRKSVGWIEHVGLNVPDVDVALAYYDEFMALVGYTRYFPTGYVPTDWKGSQIFIYPAVESGSHSRPSSGATRSSTPRGSTPSTASTATPPSSWTCTASCSRRPATPPEGRGPGIAGTAPRPSSVLRLTSEHHHRGARRHGRSQRASAARWQDPGVGRGERYDCCMARRRAASGPSDSMSSWSSVGLRAS